MADHPMGQPTEDTPGPFNVANDEACLSYARRQVIAQANWENPTINDGQTFGWFAVAVQEAPVNPIGEEWLTQFYTDLLYDLPADCVADYRGVLLAGLFSRHLSDDIMPQTKMFLAMRTPRAAFNDLLDTSSLISLHDDSRMNGYQTEWSSIRKFRDFLVVVLQHVVINGLSDDGITAEKGTALFRSMKDVVQQACFSVLDMASKIQAEIPLCKFKENFRNFYAHLKNGDFEMSSIGTQKWCLEGLQVPEANPTDFSKWHAEATKMMSQWSTGEVPINAETAYAHVGEAMQMLNKCMAERDAAQDKVKELLAKREVFNECNAELLDNFAGKAMVHLHSFDNEE